MFCGCYVAMLWCARLSVCLSNGRKEGREKWLPHCRRLNSRCNKNKIRRVLHDEWSLFARAPAHLCGKQLAATFDEFIQRLKWSCSVIVRHLNVSCAWAPGAQAKPRKRKGGKKKKKKTLNLFAKGISFFSLFFLLREMVKLFSSAPNST